MGTVAQNEEQKSPLKEIVQPFADLAHAPRALWGINFPYILEGLAYFGVVQYLAMYFDNYLGLNEIQAHREVGLLTAGITISMFFLGAVSDFIGVRRAIILAFFLLICGRILLSVTPYLGLGKGVYSAANGMSLGGILLIVLGYGMYQPGAYSAVKQFTSEKTAAMGFAMLYALMNLGGWLPTFFTPIREAFGISGAYWVLSGGTVLALLCTLVLLSPKTVAAAIASAKVERAKEEERKQQDATEGKPEEEKPAAEQKPSFEGLSGAAKLWHMFRHHPLADAKFSYFIFCLIPVQTLFAYNWLVLPQYVERAYRGTWIGDHFEAAVNFNPILIFVLVPLVAAATRKNKVYNMMILGTAVMSLPTFFLAFGPGFWQLLGYIVIMTIGEAMWQPRFLQYAAEIAPPGRTGQYMGVAQFPWFLTKMIVPLYSGWFIATYCPKDGPTNTGTMWLIFSCIAVCSTILLVAAKGWLGKDFKSKA